MAVINMKEWMQSVISSKKRIAIPVMTHPGIEFIEKNVVDACRDGQTHFDAIMALNKKYPASATTVIMDLTVEAEAFGADVIFPDDEVPSVVGRLVCSAEDIEALQVPTMDKGRVQEYIKANRLTAEAISDKPVISGCIGPFSLAGRLYDMTEIMMGIYIEPESINLLLEKCTEFITAYILELKKTGVNGIVIAEPAAGLLSDGDCNQFSSVFVRKIVETVQDDNFSVILHNCANSGHCTEATVYTGAAAYHFGNKMDMVDALENTPKDVLIMGNLDPVGVMKDMNAEDVFKEAMSLLERTKDYPNFVLSTGCDTPPNIPMGNIDAFYHAVDQFNK